MVTVLLCLLYFVCVLGAVPIAGPAVTPWLLACLSAAFVWCYLVYARGRPMIAVAVVVIVTLVLPMVALIAIGWPLYRSWSTLGASLWAAFHERGTLRIVEFAAPAVAATICAGLLGRLRPKIVVESNTSPVRP